MTLHAAAQAFLEHLRTQGKSERTLYTYGKDFEQLEAFFGSDRLCWSSEFGVAQPMRNLLNDRYLLYLRGLEFQKSFQRVFTTCSDQTERLRSFNSADFRFEIPFGVIQPNRSPR